MFTIRIEHPVPSFEGWKKAFESDPIGRQKSGVIRHRVSQLVEDAKFVAIELDFDSLEKANLFLDALKVLWGKVEGKVMTAPQARIFQSHEIKEY